MRARAAYIRSLGTTGILVVAALLMLGVVGAVVGFHRWPEGAVGGTVPSVPLKTAPQRVLTAVRDVRKAPTASLTRAARAVGDRSATAGLVKASPVVSSPRPVGQPLAYEPGEVAPQPAEPPATPAHDPQAPAPPSAPSTPVPAPSTPPDVQQLLGQLLGAPPPPPGAGPQPGPLQVDVPIVGTTITAPPPPPSR
jgi:hypothetical protein